MSVKDFFSSRRGGKISQKKIAGKKWSKSGVMEEFLKNPAIAKAFDKSSERGELFGLMGEMGKDGLTKTEMKEIIGKGIAGKLRTISRKESSILGKELFGDERVRYIMPKNNLKSTSVNVSRSGVKSGVGNPPRKSIRANTTKFVPAGLGASIYRNNPIKEGASEEKSGDFFRAVNAVRKNRRN